MKLKWIISLCLFLAVTASAKTRKTVFVIIDGVPADMIERLNTPAIDEIASRGSFSRAYTGGEVGGYSQTPTISAIGYTNLLTATWLNKHNVDGNSNLKPNYNYWTIFRIAKEQEKDYKTAIYSSWTDNRTVLLGEGKPETNHLKIDYVRDGYDLDTKRFPKKEKDLHIFDIDEQITKDAAQGIRKDAPDLSWVYLWYTDDAGHIYGNSDFFDRYTLLADKQVKRIWDAVKYREANFDEEWLVIITTDHGRGDDGHHHGGQSDRERTCWISTNVKPNSHFAEPCLSIVDINPTICRYMGFKLPDHTLWEQDGVPFIGQTYIAVIETTRNDNSITLKWQSLNDQATATIYVSKTNHFNQGATDEWVKVGKVKAGTGEYTYDISEDPQSFYKFAVVTRNNHLTCWSPK